MFSKSKTTFYLILTLLVIFLFILFKPSLNKQYYFTLLKTSFTDTVQANVTEESKKCFIKIFSEWKKGEQVVWLEIANLVKACAKNILKYIPYLETSPETPEHKYYMVPKLQYINDSCFRRLTRASKEHLEMSRVNGFFKESSEFIIAADVDDVLIPKEQNYYKEFSHWAKIYPFAAAFMYYRKSGVINAANSFGNFSLFNTLSSLSIGGENLIGKSVYQTKIAESAWIHWPFFKNETTAIIKNGGKMLHVAIDNPLDEKLTIMSHKDLKSVTTTFFETFKNFPSFSSNTAYAKAISNCHGESVSWNSTDQPCLTEMRCSKPKIVKDFKCQVAKRNFSSAFLNENIVFHIPYSDYFWEKSENGCNLFVN